MILNGTDLTGGNPAELEQWLVELAETTGTCPKFGPRGNPGIDGLGLVLRVQDTADGPRTRPVLVGRACEWVGYLWPDSRLPRVKQRWTPPDYDSPWSGWKAPF